MKLYNLIDFHADLCNDIILGKVIIFNIRKHPKAKENTSLKCQRGENFIESHLGYPHQFHYWWR